MRPGSVACARTRGDDARHGGGARRPFAIGGTAPQPDMTKPPAKDSTNRLVAVTLDEESIGRSSPDIDHERSVAIYDLIEENSFALIGHKSGPYTLNLSLKENRLVFDIRREDGKPVIAHLLSLTPFKKI